MQNNVSTIDEQASLPHSDGSDGLFGNIRTLARSPMFMIPLMLTVLLTYGFFCMHYTVSADDLSGERYVSDELFAQGRFTWTIVARFLKVFEGYAFFDATLAILLLAFSAIVLCAVFLCVTKGRLPIPACTVFATLFMSYPLLSESFSYHSLPFFLAIGSLLSSASFYLIFRARKHLSAWSIIMPSILLMLAASLYESVLMLYVFLVFASLLLEVRTGQSRLTGFRSLVVEGLRYLLPLVIGVVLEALVSAALIAVLQIEPSANADNSIVWGSLGLMQCLKQIVQGFFYNDVIKGLVYLPIGVLVGSMLVMLIYAISDTFRHRKLHVVILYAGLFLTLVLLSLIQGKPSPYRVLYVFAYFIAFAGLLLAQTAMANPLGFKRYAILGLLSLLVFHQANDLNHWFVLEDRRFENEVATIRQIGYDLRSRFDTDKPVVFIGNYSNNMGKVHFAHTYVTDPSMVTLVNQLRELVRLDPVNSIAIQETNNNSYIAWSTYAWGDFSDLIKFFALYGIDLQAVSDKDTLAEARTLSLDMPDWPADGYIRDAGQYLIVKFAAN